MLHLETDMTDLSETFSKSRLTGIVWNQERFLACLESIAKRSDKLEVDWEEGERWGRVLKGDVVVSCVCLDFPFLFLHKSLAELLYDEITIDLVNVVAFDDFTKREYSVSKDVLERVFDRELTNEVNYDLISVEEIWFATV